MAHLLAASHLNSHTRVDIELDAQKPGQRMSDAPDKGCQTSVADLLQATSKESQNDAIIVEQSSQCYLHF